MALRCVLCNESISEKEMSGAIKFVHWEAFGPYRDELHDAGGQLIPLEGTNGGVRWNDRWGQVHWCCESCYGTGQTPFAWATQMAESMRDFQGLQLLKNRMASLDKLYTVLDQGGKLMAEMYMSCGTYRWHDVDRFNKYHGKHAEGMEIWAFAAGCHLY